MKFSGNHLTENTDKIIDVYDLPKCHI